ncbi:MAG TPA: LemA family protein [Candidatus Sulfotelmatobacter sp.]|nr:LemA family protein [Candidatus Sulfotelmatobacter sp.]
MEKWNKPWVWIVGIIIVLLLFIGGSYNRLVGLDQNVTQSWAQVENQLQRRNDLIPNLVATVKGYSKHESSIFIEVAAARTRLAGVIKTGTATDKISAAKDMDTALSRLLAIAENYPDLKASANFIRLQDELAGTENRIAVERMRYNQAVQSYNTAAKMIPTVIFVNWFGFDKAKPYFEAAPSAKAAPKVEF